MLLEDPSLPPPLLLLLLLMSSDSSRDVLPSEKINVEADAFFPTARPVSGARAGSAVGGAGRAASHVRVTFIALLTSAPLSESVLAVSTAGRNITVTFFLSPGSSLSTRGALGARDTVATSG